MTALTDFLLARIAEDEAVAEVATDGTARWGGWAEFADFGISARASAHVLRHDPARVLAECEAKRRIAEAWIEADRTAGAYPGTDAGIEMGLALALELLALPYADHPDYREEWRA